jgi:hypothetical protein
MGDVIKGAFGAPKRPKAEPAKEPEAPEEIPLGQDIANIFRMALGQISSMGIEMDEKLKAKMEAMKIQGFLNDLKGPISPEAVKTARVIWKARKTVELLAAAQASTKLEWTKYPGRFRALADELTERSF